jgi:hypothetical protein
MEQIVDLHVITDYSNSNYFRNETKAEQVIAVVTL